VLGTTIICIAIRPVYNALLEILGSKGFLFSYADDVYKGGVPTRAAIELTIAPDFYVMVDIQL